MSTVRLTCFICLSAMLSCSPSQELDRSGEELSKEQIDSAAASQMERPFRDSINLDPQNPDTLKLQSE